MDTRPRTQPDITGLILTSLDQRWEKYRKELSRCRRQCSERAVHDLRVAGRRLISVLEIIATCAGGRDVEDLRSRVRKRFKSMASVRDVQVQLLRAEGMRGAFPDIEPFFTLLLLRERRLLKRIERQVLKERPADLATRVQTLRARVSASLELPGMNNAAALAALGAIAGAFGNSAALLDQVDGNDVKSIHRFRVSFKKFRYRVEALLPLLPRARPELLKEMNAYQVRMGEIQDIGVFISALNLFLKSSGRARGDFLRVRQELEQRRHELVDEFLTHSREFYTFWSPEVPSRPDSVQQVV
jgi:CHAD domain-containing protein